MLDSTPTLFSADTQETEFRERVLLGIAGVFLFIAHTGLIVAQNQGTYWPVLAWCVCAAAGHIVLQRRVPRRDPFIFPIVMFLSGWGLSLIERLAPPFAARQAIW